MRTKVRNCATSDKGQERTFPGVADFLKLTDTSTVYPSCKGHELVIEAIWLLQEGRMPHAIEP